MSDNIIQLNADLIHTELKDLVKNDNASWKGSPGTVQV